MSCSTQTLQPLRRWHDESVRRPSVMHEDLDAFAIVAGAPRWVGVEAVEVRRPRKGIEAVVEHRREGIYALLLSEASDGAADPLVELIDNDCRRPVREDPAVFQVGDADANRIPITDESKALSIGPLRDELAL